MRAWRWMLLVLCVGCGDGNTDDTHQGYMFMPSDVQDFLTWHHVPLNDGVPELHRGFINQVPAGGSKRFDKGTVIIKTEEPSANPNDWHVYGMAKRGVGYNANGAAGWEWFELKYGQRGRYLWALDWRGSAPPNGATYRCVESMGPNAPDCNTCHHSAYANDYVMSDALDLGGFH